MKSYLHGIEKCDIPSPKKISDPSFEAFTAVDIETTGLKRTECIIEIAAIKVRNYKAVGKFCTLVRPKKYIPSLIEEITGITNIMVSDAPRIEEVIPEFVKFVGDDILLGHNIVSFDSKFLCREAAEVGLSLNNKLFDTLTYARRLKKLTDMPSSLSLTALNEFFGIERESAHRAYDDALSNVKLFYTLRALEKEITK